VKPRRTGRSLRPRSLRARFGLALALLVALILVNIGSFSWGGRQRSRVFQDLQRAIERHSALNEALARLEAEEKQVRVVSDLLGVDGHGVDPAELDGVLARIRQTRDSLDAALAGTEDPALVRIAARADSLAVSWTTFYSHLGRDPEAALEEVVLRAEPLAGHLLTQDLPAVIRAQRSRVQLASSAFAGADRMWYRTVWTILLASALLFAVMAWSLSRDLLRAIGVLKMGAERFGSAELSHRIEVENFNELGEVGERMNAMAQRLRRAHEELEVRNEELALLAFRDALTKLSNRALFRERVEMALRAVNGTGTIAVLFVDLDNFKAVNDTYGHSAGDRLLVEVAARLLHATRGCDTVARLGGDEFAILLDVQQGDEAAIVAERIIASLRKPFSLDDRTVHIGASVGLACGQDGDGTDELLRNADVAMYAAKDNGRGRYHVFAPAMHEALLDRAELEADLRAALQRKEFSLEYQPIVELESESIIGYEALIRWRNPKRGAVEPSTFVPIAEECGVILPLGRWVLREACREAARWEQMLPAVPITVNVNVSSHQLEHPEFIDDLTEALQDTGLDPSRLVLEITESVIMRDSALNLERLRMMKSLGVRLAIDDFGTGFSSLAYLQRFPVDVIKIDKAFVKSVAISANDAALARTIIMLSETLRLKTVAEGIEYRDQQAMLQSLGCELGQGYLYSTPLAPSEIRASLRSHARIAKAMGNRGGAGVHIGLVRPEVPASVDIATAAGRIHRA